MTFLFLSHADRVPVFRDALGRALPDLRFCNTARVRDDCVMATLALHRDLPGTLQQQREKRWEGRGFTWADQRRVGVMVRARWAWPPLPRCSPLGFSCQAGAAARR